LTIEYLSAANSAVPTRSTSIICCQLAIVGEMPALPRALRPLQRLLVRAAVRLVPAQLRRQLGLGAGWGLPPGAPALLRSIGTAADRVVLATHPAVQACRRLGLPDDYLQARR